MKHKTTTLQNGLRIITVPVPTSESVTISFWIGVGSRSENDSNAGVSHFLEHMVFKGSVKRPTAKEIAEAVDGFGGEFNAGTSKEWTNFYIKASKSNITKAFDVLYDMVINPVLDSKEIEREKGVILEEMSMYEDTPMYKIGDVYENLIFKGDNLGKDIIGNAISIKNMKRDDFLRYREDHYYTDNIVITVSGGIDEKVVIDLCNSYFKDLKKKGNIEETNFNFKYINDRPRIILKYKDIEQVHLIFGYVSGERGNKDMYIENVLAAVLGQGMSSRLFTEVRERRGLAYSVRTGIDRYADTGTINTYAGVEPSKVEEAIRVIRDEHMAIASGDKPISDSELSKAKEFVKGHFALSLEDTTNINTFYGQNELLLGEIITPEETIKGIDSVSREDVVRVAKQHFKNSAMNLAIIGPFKDEKKFAKLLS